MTPTPAQFRDPVLCTLGKFVGFQPGVEVGSTEVTEAVIAGLPEVPDDIRKARNNVNWAATQVLRQAGLVSPANKRGFWGLTVEGVEEARKLAGVPEDASTPPVAAAVTVATVRAPDPVPSDPPAPPPSPWADDPAGVVVYVRSVADDYGDDGYIRALGIEQTRCFGGYQETAEVCGRCPVAKSCRSKQFAKFAAVAERLRQQDAEATAKGIAPSAPTHVEMTMDEDIHDVLDEIEKTPVAPTVDPGMETTAVVDGICYKCLGTIVEGATYVFVPSRGGRHVACPP